MSFASFVVFVLILFFITYAGALLLALAGLRQVPEPSRYPVLALGSGLLLAGAISLMLPEDGGQPWPWSLLWATPTSLYWLWQHLRDYRQRQLAAARPRPAPPLSP